MSYKWNYAVYNLLRLAVLIKNNSFAIHLGCFIFMARKYSMVWIFQLVQSFTVEEDLRCLQVWASMNQAAMSSHTQVFVWYKFSFSGIKNQQTLSQNDWTILQSQYMSCAVSSHFCQYLVLPFFFFFFFGVSSSDSVLYHLIIAWIYISLMANDAKYFLLVLFSICISELSIHVFIHFPLGLFVLIA